MSGPRLRVRVLLRRLGVDISRPGFFGRIAARYYASGPRVPWSPGYADFKNRVIVRALHTPAMMRLFSEGGVLPSPYGAGLDERCVELPWFFAHAGADAVEYLDAGSALNHQDLLRHPYWRGRRLTVVTVAPESRCFWHRGISYQFADLRRLPFRDSWFDEVACLSTLEHVGMDNRLYDSADPGRVDIDAHRLALGELRRVLRPGGRLLLTVPFGRYENHGFFQQFDAALLDRAAAAFEPMERVDTFYRYEADGWQLATPETCGQCSYSAYVLSRWVPGAPPRPPEPDGAAAARAVACCVWRRP
jgi:SAM-dependent methyltransferase